MGDIPARRRNTELVTNDFYLSPALTEAYGLFIQKFLFPFHPSQIEFLAVHSPDMNNRIGPGLKTV